MSAHSLDGLMKWLRRDEWRDAFQEVLDLHLSAACSEAGVEIDELPEFLDAIAFGNLWGCAFEDFLTQEDEDGRNIVDDYVKRRGWKEGAANKRYMAGLRHAVMSLYEVSAVDRGKTLMLRDLVRGGDPVRVTEHSASKSLRQWDRIAARLIGTGDATILAGGLLYFDQAMSEEALREIKAVRQKLVRQRRKIAAEVGVGADDPHLARALSFDSLLRSAGPMFSTIWLTDALEKALSPAEPQMTNMDGEDLVFVAVSFPIKPGASIEAVRATLNAVPDLRAENPTFWNWVRVGDAKRRKPTKPSKAKQLALGLLMDDGAIVLGTVEIEHRYVNLQANSVERAQRGAETLASALGSLVGEPTQEETSVYAMAKSQSGQSGAKSLGLPPDEERQIVHAAMEQHYRRQLDERIPSLGDITPRQAARSKAGREKLVNWLKLLENQTARVTKTDPMASFDFGWMWRELGIENERR